MERERRKSILRGTLPFSAFLLPLVLVASCNKETEQADFVESQQQLQAKSYCSKLWAAEIGAAKGEGLPDPLIALIPKGSVSLGVEVLESTTFIGSNVKSQNTNLQQLLSDLETKKYQSELQLLIDRIRKEESGLFGTLCKENGIDISEDGQRGFRVVFDTFKSETAGSAQNPATVADANSSGNDCKANVANSANVTVPHEQGQKGTAHFVLADHGSDKLAAKVNQKLEGTVEYVEVDSTHEDSAAPAPAPASAPASADNCKEKPGYLLVRSEGVPIGIVLNVPKRAREGFNDPAPNETGGLPGASAGGVKTNWNVISAGLSAGSDVIKSTPQTFQAQQKVFRCLDLASESKNAFPPLIMFESVKKACAEKSKQSARPKN